MSQSAAARCFRHGGSITPEMCARVLKAARAGLPMQRDRVGAQGRAVEPRRRAHPQRRIGLADARPHHRRLDVELTHCAA